MKRSLGIHLKMNCLQYQRTKGKSCYYLLTIYKNIKYYNILQDFWKIHCIKYTQVLPSLNYSYEYYHKTKISLNVTIKFARVNKKIIIYLNRARKSDNFLQKTVFEILPYKK